MWISLFYQLIKINMAYWKIKSTVLRFVYPWYATTIYHGAKNYAIYVLFCSSFQIYKIQFAIKSYKYNPILNLPPKLQKRSFDNLWAASIKYWYKLLKTQTRTEGVHAILRRYFRYFSKSRAFCLTKICHRKTGQDQFYYNDI